MTNEQWIEAFKAKGHSPKLKEDGELDIFFYECHHCNGPGCEICDFSLCMWCYAGEELDECDVIEGTLVTPLLESSKDN